MYGQTIQCIYNRLTSIKTENKTKCHHKAFDKHLRYSTVMANVIVLHIFYIVLHHYLILFRWRPIQYPATYMQQLHAIRTRGERAISIWIGRPSNSTTRCAFFFFFAIWFLRILYRHKHQCKPLLMWCACLLLFQCCIVLTEWKSAKKKETKQTVQSVWSTELKFTRCGNYSRAHDNRWMHNICCGYIALRIQSYRIHHDNYIRLFSSIYIPIPRPVDNYKDVMYDWIFIVLIWNELRTTTAVHIFYWHFTEVKLLLPFGTWVHFVVVENFEFVCLCDCTC